MMKPLVSVIVPIYNVEAYLEKCLNSILSQSYENLEIILVDDGSSDGCGGICDRYAQVDSRIRVIHQENQGVSAARNAGLEIMNGDYAMFVDADDWLGGDAVAVLFERMERDGSDMAIGKAVRIWNDGKMQHTYCGWMYDMVISGEQALMMLGTRQDIPCYAGAKLYKSCVFSRICFPRLSCGEDVWVLPYILSACNRISLLEHTVYYYYQRPTSVVHSAGERQITDSITAAWHTARFLLDRRMWSNGAAYYDSGLFQARKLKDTGKVRELYWNSFSGKEHCRLMSGNWKDYLYLLRLYVPGLRKNSD